MDWQQLIRAYHNGQFDISPDRIGRGGLAFERDLRSVAARLGHAPSLLDLSPKTCAFEVMTRPHQGLVGHLGAAHEQASSLGHDPLWLECALARFLCRLSQRELVAEDDHDALFSFNLRLGGYDPIRLDGIRQILRYYHVVDADLLSSVAFEIIEDLELSEPLLKALWALSEVFGVRFVIDDVGSLSHDVTASPQYMERLLGVLGDRIVGYKIDYGLNRTMDDHVAHRAHVQANLAALRELDANSDRLVVFEGATLPDRHTLKPADWFENTRKDANNCGFKTVWYQLG